MNKILSGIILLLISNFSLAAELSFLVVDIEYVIASSNAAKNVNKQIEEKKKKYENDIANQEKQLRSDEEQLKKEQKTLSQDAFDKKVRNFQTKLAEMQRGVQMKRNDLEEMNLRALNKISEVTTNIINEIAKERKIQLILPTSQILYAEKTADVTPEVLKKLNEKLSKVSVQ